MAPKIPTRIPPDYLVLPLTLPAVPSLPTPATHYLYIRRHTPTVPTPNDARTLFLTNLPVDATEPHLRALFLSLSGGRLEKLLFNTTSAADTPPEPTKKRKRNTKPDGGATSAPQAPQRALHPPGSPALALFLDRASAEQTLSAVQAHLKAGSPAPVWGEGVTEAHNVPALGVARYRAAHAARYPDPAALAAGIDAFMVAFAEAEEEARRAAARRRTEVDEDGFVTVVRGGRGANASVAREQAERALAEQREKEEKRRLKGFYRWQVREEGKERQKRLLDAFERDKELVERRKKGRSFVPL